MGENVNLQAMSETELMALYKENKELEVKQELTLRYLTLIRKIAFQMRNVYLNFSQMDDIINESVLAVMNGIDKFEPEQNVKFETFITKRIRGLIIDLARKQDWIPRSVRQTAKEIDQTAADLFTELGRIPTEEEIAEKMNLPLEQYQQEVGKSDFFQILSLDSVLTDVPDSVTMKHVNSSERMELPEDHVLREERKEQLIEAIGCLREKEKLVVSLYYQQDLNMKDIAKVLEISEARVSQLHSAALRRMRQYLEQKEGLHRV